MLRRLYDWTLELAGRRHATHALAVIGFLESSVFPIPIDVMIVPMVLSTRERAWIIATVATLASVAGGVAGYFIGLFLYDTLGRWLLDLYGYAARFAEFQSVYREWGAWIVVGGALTPFPYKVTTIASGVAEMNLGVFVVASVLARGARFFAVAGLMYLFGPPIRDLIDRYFGLLTTVFFLLLIGGFAAVRLLG